MFTHLAYLDLGAGSMLLQMMLAGALGLGFTVKTYWKRIIGRFRRKPEDEAPITASPSDENP